MISIVINADSRPGCDAAVQTTGDHGGGSLHGVRSWDFLTDGVTNKLNFFHGHDVEVVLFVDEHDPIPEEVMENIRRIERLDQFVCKQNVRRVPRWNEMLYLEALQLARGEYIAHFDGDCAAFKAPDWDAGTFYKNILNMGDGYRFVCQPTTMTLEEHGMDWASTRFFMCRRDWLDLDEVEKCIANESYRIGKYGHTPALEHVLGKMARKNGVLYPPADWNQYMVFSWSRYHKGLLAELNAWDYKDVRKYIVDECGIHGPNDVISKPFNEALPKGEI